MAVQYSKLGSPGRAYIICRRGASTNYCVDQIIFCRINFLRQFHFMKLVFRRWLEAQFDAAAAEAEAALMQPAAKRIP